jgi:hypothetical protein
MSLEVQHALASLFRAADEFDGIAIHASSDDKEIPGDQPAVVVVCDTAESPVAGLYRATVQITLSTPCLLQDGLETHRTLASVLRQQLGDLAQLSTHLPETLAYSGRHLTSWSDSREDERWLTTAELVLGIREI